MAVAIAMPKLGMTMAEGTVVAWQSRVGDVVQKGHTLLVIESEKSELEIESPIDGTVRHIYVDDGALVPCGTLLGALTERADEAFDAEVFRVAHERANPVVQTAGPTADATSTRTAATPTSAAKGGEPTRVPITPAARRRAEELGLDPTCVAGSGPSGRVTRDDVEAYGARMAARIEVASGVHLDVPSAGDGDPVVLLPGFGTDASAFAPHITDLAASWRVLAVNPRGVAFSDAPDSELYEIATAADDVAHVADGKLHVVGASMGATIAVELALMHPWRIRSLTLITPLVRATARLRAVTDAWIAAASAGSDVLGRMLVAWMFSESFLEDDGRRERAARSIAQTCGRVPAPVLTRWAAGLRAWSGTRTSALATIDAPTLVIAAGDDMLTPDAAAVAAAIPNARLAVVEQAGHAVAIEKAVEVSSLIREHLRAS